MPALLISVRFHDGRYHGRAQGGPDWPPSPARLFQALVAGAARGAMLVEADREALSWLERLDPPAIAAPASRRGRFYVNFVPNNDLDAVGGDPKRVGEIRAGKAIRPILFDAETPLLYLWRFEEKDAAQAKRVCALAEQLYQLGRGVDMAWAWGELLEDAAAEERFAAYLGAIYRPSRAGAGAAFAAPGDGSLASLADRHKAGGDKFDEIQTGRAKQTVFRQPPKPRFRQINYDSPPTRLLFDLAGGSAPWRLDHIAELTEKIRDAAAAKLENALKNRPEHAAPVAPVLIGRNAIDADKAQRVRITPLPSIGHDHADRAIRRVLVEIPPNCPLPVGDLEWAFSGLAVVSGDGEILVELLGADDDSMPRHYGIESDVAHRIWRSVTPAALPVARRRIAPERRRDEAKGAGERADEERKAANAVFQALRHTDVNANVASVRVRREPFAAKGARAEAFEPVSEELKKRFSKHRLWHVEIVFSEPQRGPLIVGDGRYYGLGLMAPEKETAGVMAFCIAGASMEGAHTRSLTRSLRRAVMARVQHEIGAGEPLPAYFTGHDTEGGPARSGAHTHLAFAYDSAQERLLVFAPHVVERRDPWKSEQRHWRTLEAALDGFDQLRAGALGVLRLSRAPLDMETDPLFAPARLWVSASSYCVTRHERAGDAHAALTADIARELDRLNLPRVKIEALEACGVAGRGLIGRARIESAAAVAGPILIGRDRHFGGGLFIAAH